ncbi:MAG TPA: phage portal protein [Planctomycetota bacterium]|nr:phage portal protein [Planctomycetota bacterium]
MLSMLKRWLTFQSRPAEEGLSQTSLPPRFAGESGAVLREAHQYRAPGTAVEWNSWEGGRRFGEVESLAQPEIQALGEALYFHNPYAHGFINLMALFMTDGLQFEARLVANEGPAGHDAEAVQGFNHQFQRWSDRQGFPELLQEIAVRWLATGECFVVNRSAAEPWRDPELRLVRNYDVASPAGPGGFGGVGAGTGAEAIQNGIETAPGDATRVVAYHVVADRLSLKTERIPAEAVLHLSLNRWQDQTRGLPVHLPLLDLLRMQQSYLTAVVRTADARSKMAIIRRVQGGPDEVASAAQKERALKANHLTPGVASASGSGGPENRESLLRSRVTTVNAGVDYEFKAFNLNADDAQTVNRLLTLPGSAALSLAEYLYSGDASTNTFASAEAAERAAFKMLKARSRVLARKLLTVVQWAHTAFELQGLIPAGGLEAGRYELGYVLPEFSVGPETGAAGATNPAKPPAG